MNIKPSIFNTKPNNPLNESMFLGQNVNTSRFDIMKFPVFDQLVKLQTGFFWTPQEVNISRDKSDFENLPPHEQYILTENLKYQTLFDSVQGRGPIECLLPITSVPELEPWLNAWSFFESAIHSRSYSYIIQQVYNDPTEVLDGVIESEDIVKRAKTIAKYGDDLLRLVTYRQCILFGDIENHRPLEQIEYDIKRKLIKYLFSVYLLESTSFYISFSCSFAFAERKKMEGMAKIIRLIARDEAVHTTAVLHILNILKSGLDGQEWVDIYQSLEEELYQIAQEVYQQELNWAEHLFKHGSMLGINKTTSIEYLEYLLSSNLSPLEMDAKRIIGDKPAKNPYPWIKEWFDSSSVQVAPQETEITSYITSVDGAISSNDLNDLMID